MRIEKKEKGIVEIQKSVRIVQDDHFLILEKGDEIQVLSKKNEAITMTPNGWTYDPHDRSMSGLPSLEKKTRDRSFLVVVTYNKDEREPFQVGEHSRADGSVDWAENFDTMAGVRFAIQKRQNLRIADEDLIILMGN